MSGSKRHEAETTARRHLEQRGIRGAEVIGQMRIGYAPGRCLRARLEALGYPAQYLRDAGLVRDWFGVAMETASFSVDGSEA